MQKKTGNYTSMRKAPMPKRKKNPQYSARKINTSHNNNHKTHAESVTSRKKRNRNPQKKITKQSTEKLPYRSRN